MKSRMTIVILITIALGGKLHFRTLSLPIGLAVNKDTIPSLKITSSNVRLFDLYEWGEDGKYVNRNAIFNYLQNQESDVFCFQEFYHQDKPTKFPTRDTLKTLLNTPSGALQTRKSGLQSQIVNIDRQIVTRQRMLASKEEILKAKFARLEETMSKIRGQGAGLAGLAGPMNPVQQLG